MRFKNGASAALRALPVAIPLLFSPVAWAQTPHGAVDAANRHCAEVDALLVRARNGDTGARDALALGATVSADTIALPGGNPDNYATLVEMTKCSAAAMRALDAPAGK